MLRNDAKSVYASRLSLQVDASSKGVLNCNLESDVFKIFYETVDEHENDVRSRKLDEQSRPNNFFKNPTGEQGRLMLTLAK